MSQTEVPDDVRVLLHGHGLESVAEHHAIELADRIRWARRGRVGANRGLKSRDRAQCVIAAKRLAKHLEQAPRDPNATQRARERLLESLDSISSVVEVAAHPGALNIAPLLQLLQTGESPTETDLAALVTALESIPPRTGTPVPKARDGLIRSAGITWRSVHGDGGYWYDSEFSAAENRGPLPRFIKAVLESAGLPMPSEDALHGQLRKLKDSG